MYPNLYQVKAAMLLELHGGSFLLEIPFSCPQQKSELLQGKNLLEQHRHFRWCVGQRFPSTAVQKKTDEDSAWLWWCDEELGLTEHLPVFCLVCKSLLKADDITVPLWNSDHVTMLLGAMAQNPAKKNERLHVSVKAVFRGQFMDLFSKSKTLVKFLIFEPEVFLT